MWLIAAWLVFGVSQVFAACCMPAGGPIQPSTQAAAAPQHQDDAAADDCCDSAEQTCQMVLDAVPPAPSPAGLFVASRIPHLGGPRGQHAHRPPAAALAAVAARIPILHAPLGPIYLRLQRFLI